MRILRPSILLLAALAACGGDSTGPGAGPDPETPRGLSSAEANAIGRAVLAPGVGVARNGASGAAPSASRGDVAAAIETGSVPFGFTVPCQSSGSVAVSGTLSAAWDIVAKAAIVHALVSVRHQACPVQSEGAVITLTGAPAVDLTLTAAGDATGLKALVITETGAVNWARSDGTSGHCAVQVIGAMVAGTPNYHVTGTVCGTSVDFTGPL